MYQDGYIHAFSSINGYPVDNVAGIAPQNQTPEVIKAKILNDVDFVGIANTEYSLDALGSYSEQGFVAQVGGVTTILNEGTADIHPGQYVMLDIDLANQRKATREKGIPRSKIRFVTSPMAEPQALIKEVLGVDPNNPANLITSLADVPAITKFLQKYRSLHSRCMGKAMSFARPGERFELNVQPRHAY